MVQVTMLAARDTRTKPLTSLEEESHKNVCQYAIDIWMTIEMNEFMQKVNLAEKFSLFQEYWNPKIVGELNDSYVKLAKFKGEFFWHQHEAEDELFFVVKGKLLIKLRDREIWLREGEFMIIPRGIEHLPIAEEEAHVLLLEPKSTVNTGNVQNERTLTRLERI